MLFERVDRWWSARAYRRKLPALLARRYGRQARYTPAQVLTTIKAHGVAARYAVLACGMFCSRTSIAQFVEERRLANDWESWTPGYGHGDLTFIRHFHDQVFGHPGNTDIFDATFQAAGDLASDAVSDLASDAVSDLASDAVSDLASDAVSDLVSDTASDRD